MALEGIVEVKVFNDKASVWILALVYDADGALIDPTAAKVSIIDPDGTTQVDEASMTQYDSTTGIYEYFYHKGEDSDPMDEGEWRGELLIIDGSGATAIITVKKFSFTVG